MDRSEVTYLECSKCKGLIGRIPAPELPPGWKMGGWEGWFHVDMKSEHTFGPIGWYRIDS